MENRIKETVERYNMLGGCKTVVAGLSGGADSMSLILFLKKYAKEYNINVIAVHINHMLRGGESDRDEGFVKAQCEKLGLELLVYSADIKTIAKRTGEGIEECARRIRYNHFEKAADSFENAKIATAHTANDNAETVLLNLTRGSGLTGICGIPPVRGRIIRPIIRCTRDEVEDYLRANGLSYITDSTNNDTAYRRNRIRKQILPLLCEINPATVNHISSMTEILRNDDDYLELKAQKALECVDFDGESLRLEALNRLHLSIKSRVLRNACEHVFSKKPGSFHLCEILKLSANGRTGQKVQLWDNCFCGVFYERLKFYMEGQSRGIKRRELKIGDNIIDEAGGVLRLKIIDRFDNVYNFDKKDMLDYVKIKSTLFLRSRQEGDCFCPIGRKHKTIKKLFIDEKVARDKRDIVPIITDGDKIIWVSGFGTGTEYAINDESKKILLISFERIGE